MAKELKATEIVKASSNVNQEEDIGRPKLVEGRERICEI
jgi:hypothetical protein